MIPGYESLRRFFANQKTKNDEKTKGGACNRAAGASGVRPKANRETSWLPLLENTLASSQSI